MCEGVQQTREFCETAGQHCFSAHTSCLSVPFVIMRPPLAFQAQRGPTADGRGRLGVWLMS